VERRALDERADPGQDAGAGLRDRLAEQLDLAARRRDQAEQHADGGRLAAAVRPEEAHDAAARHEQLEVVDRDLPAAEALGQPGGAHGGVDLRRRTDRVRRLDGCRHRRASSTSRPSGRRRRASGRRR
jgi:hypothetical protein